MILPGGEYEYICDHIIDRTLLIPVSPPPEGNTDTQSTDSTDKSIEISSQIPEDMIVT